MLAPRSGKTAPVSQGRVRLSHPSPSQTDFFGRRNLNTANKVKEDDSKVWRVRRGAGPRRAGGAWAGAPERRGSSAPATRGLLLLYTWLLPHNKHRHTYLRSGLGMPMGHSLKTSGFYDPRRDGMGGHEQLGQPVPSGQGHSTAPGPGWVSAFSPERRGNVLGGESLVRG